MKKWVYLFDEVREVEKATGGDWDDVKGLVGGKGAGLLDMTRAQVPVPPFFTVTTEACNEYQKAGKFPPGMWDQELSALKRIEKKTGKKFGDPHNPLLVSCRSGAKFSMPGMMDTVLNIGLTDETAAGMVKLTGNPRFVYDSYRRLVEMFGTVVLGIRDEAFEAPLDEYKKKKGYKLDIRFRMLQPHELAGAMSFPGDYQFAGSRELKVKQIGNAVAVRLARALFREILSDQLGRRTPTAA